MIREYYYTEKYIKNPPRGICYLSPSLMRSVFSALRASRTMALRRRSRLDIGLLKRICDFFKGIIPLCRTLRLKRRMIFSLASLWSFLVTLIAILKSIIAQTDINYKGIGRKQKTSPTGPPCAIIRIPCMMVCPPYGAILFFLNERRTYDIKMAPQGVQYQATYASRYRNARMHQRYFLRFHYQVT